MASPANLIHSVSSVRRYSFPTIDRQSLETTNEEFIADDGRRSECPASLD